MSQQLEIVVLGMARYADWASGISNRQLEVLNQLKDRSDVATILAVDMAPLRWRDVLKNLWLMWAKPCGESVWSFARPWRRLFKVSNKLWVLSSVRLRSEDIRAAQRVAGITNPVAWSYSPLSSEIVSELKPRSVAFDAVDNWLEHPFYSAWAEQIRAGYEWFGKSAACIFTVNQRNASLFAGRDDVLQVQNGVAVERYSSQLKVPEEMAKLQKPIIGYVGTIQGRLDIQLIEALATSHAVGSIALVGPIWYPSLAAQLRALPKVHLLGRQSWWRTPDFVRSFDVGIVPHKLSSFSASMDPMKVYEYLAAGIPVVSTGQEIGTAETFVAAVEEALAGDSEELRQSRRAAAADCDWAKRVDTMVTAIQSKIV
jgi:glycosyltransferase involved in cell wall biosynthesis